MSADWSEWSEPQLRCLIELSFAVPLHETHLRQRAKARANTLRSLEEAGLIRFQGLQDEFAIAPMPFWRLTQLGCDVKRDYINWHKRLEASLGALPPTMKKVADAA